MFLPKLRIVWSPSASLRISPATRPWPTFQYVELTTGISAMVKYLFMASMLAVVPARLATAMLAPGFRRKMPLAA